MPTIVIQLSLITPDSRSKITQMFLDNNIGILSLNSGNAKPKTKEDKLAMSLRHDENMVGCSYAVAIETDESVVRISELIKLLDISYFGGIVSSTKKYHFVHFGGNIKKASTEENI